jgi:hypothetical protein
MSEREAYVEKQQAEIEEIEARLRQLQAQAKQAKAAAKIEGYEWLDELEPKHDEARQKLEALRQASESSWAELKAGVRKATDDLREAVDRATSQLRA